jgi:quinol-cytochrome oxidoreductase complex cytochrome b subunit
VPFAFIVLGIAVLVLLVQVLFRPTRREMIIALFTGFVVTYLVLTFFGTSFRGPGQDLYWPWDLVGLEH